MSFHGMIIFVTPDDVMGYSSLLKMADFVALARSEGIF
jgi:hypothetical protein